MTRAAAVAISLNRQRTTKRRAGPPRRTMPSLVLADMLRQGWFESDARKEWDRLCQFNMPEAQRLARLQG